ncbi:MAG: amino acid adenylation domain-containing protein [Verrucomicrobiota bacterium]
MKREPIDEAYALSPMQQGMLYHSLSARQPGVDIEQIIIELPETLNKEAFERAWQWAAERHAILRTSFHWEGGDEPVQRVNREVDTKLHAEDWRSLEPEEQQRRWECYLRAERDRGFELQCAPLFRLAVFRLDGARHRFLWTFHHLLLDGRAIVVLLTEVFDAYESFMRGEELKLPIPRPYRSYIEWVRKLDEEKAAQFWRRTLAGFATPTPLPCARAAKGAATDRTRVKEIRLSETITAALKAAARDHGLTLNTMVQGAWALLLNRYSGETDVVFGAVRACRHGSVEGAEFIVGLFINTVPLRVRVDSEATVASWLKTVRAQWVALREFEHTPLVKIQNWSELPRGRAMFESIFNLQDPSWDAALRSQGGKWAQRTFSIRSQSNYPLAIDAYGGDTVLIKAIYHGDRFDDADIERMLGHFKTLLEAMATGVERRVGELDLLTESERRQLLIEWSATDADPPRDQCVHELFEDIARRMADAPAVKDQHTQLTYRELNDQADELAAQLRACGVGPEVCAGVCLERSVQMVIALLAVLKAGGAYVPLDPAYPKDRLLFMLDDAKAPVIITNESLRQSLGLSTAHSTILCLDNPSSLPNPHPPTLARSAPPHPRNLAYVIYTSGSTGTPKGVEIEHRSLVNLIEWHQRTYCVTLADRATQLAAPGFDASVWELWPYLTAGASIHIPDDETRLSSGKLIAWLAANKITLTFVPTPLAEAMLDEPWPKQVALRAVLTGGDKLHRAPGGNFPCPLLNHYGPTENTVVTTWTAVPPGATNPAAPPIGRPISNTRVYVLDTLMRPVPVSIPGELYIGGVGLARGYHNQPGLTAEKFVPDPFTQKPGARLYKTGDLVRYLADGNIEFIGRIDSQVKIRGNRVETGEIEAVLTRLEDVREAAVAIRETAPGKPNLIAYVVPQPGRELQPQALRDFLKQHVPDYMVPAAFVALDSFPLTPNGKVDRAALPSPPMDTTRARTPPRTATEQALADIWREVLGVEHVGVHDDFFELGGHSLLATQVVSRVRTGFGVDVPVYDLFEASTVATFAEKIEATGPLAHDIKPAALTHTAESRDHPLSFPQERLWFIEQLEPGQPFNNIPMAIRLEGALDVGALERAFNELVRRHGTLRTSFKASNGRPIAAVLTPFLVNVANMDLNGLSIQEREPLIGKAMAEEAARPFDLESGQLLRVQLLRLGDREHILLFTTHHIACDGWSMGVLSRELSSLYEAFVNLRPSPLPQLNFDYADFARWQRASLRGEALEKLLDYWKGRLPGARTALDLPTDRPRPPVQTYHGGIKYFSLPAGLSGPLRRVAQRENATLFMVLLAAFEVLLQRYTGQEDLLIGSPVAGRTRVETESLVGLFLNTLVLRGDLSGDPAFRELLQRVRATTLDALEHQDVPFEKLVDELKPERDLSRSPLFQVMFVLQNEPLRALELAGLKLTPLPVHSGTAKFELTLSLEEGPEGLSGYVEFNTDLFDTDTITRLIGHYQALLEGVIADLEARVSELPLLTYTEQRQLLVEWNATDVTYPAHKCVHQLISEQVARTPDATAVVFDEVQLTYRELDLRANALAYELQALGVGPDVRVAICVKRSLEMTVGLLAILKAGGCYVPLDPTYPQERLTFMLQDSKAPVLFIQEGLQAQFKFELPNLKLLCLDAPRQTHVARDAALQSRIAPPVTTSPDNLAYVIYTSGSTGKPKGVMVTHRNVVNFFTGMDKVLGTKPGVWLALTSISFDISVLELFWTLSRGFKVVIQPDEERTRPATSPGTSSNGVSRSVPEQIVRHSVTHVQCTPSLAGTFVLAPESLKALGQLDKLLLGGEALPDSLATKLRQTLRGDLLNMYGPTETTVWSASHLVREDGPTIPIGRPIANTTIYILDRNLQPVPVGLPGELFIGGAGVARGYLNRPELTAEKFLPDPFSTTPNARLYRTGDLARYRRDGTIEFLGRLDHQIKLRGFRIELGEIESTLRQHPSVRECVTRVWGTTATDQQLAAYLVAAQEPLAEPAELRRFLSQRLPDYMVPASFAWLDKLPLTPNGKADRKALPKPERPRTETSGPGPRTERERAIAKIWHELLRIGSVGLHDNFFDLGGNSLLVVQAQARLREHLGVNLPVVTFFQYPTIAALAGHLGEHERPPAESLGDRGSRKQAAYARRAHEQEVAA